MNYQIDAKKKEVHIGNPMSEPVTFSFDEIHALDNLVSGAEIVNEKDRLEKLNIGKIEFKR